MPYIPVELDALNQVPFVAAAAAVEPARITHGLVQLWAYVFRTGNDKVTRVHLRGFFGADVADALAAFGFIAPDQSPDTFRAKGAADRLLRKRAGQIAGGHAAKGNLKRGKQLPGAETPAGAKPEGEPGPSREEAGESARLDPGPTPNTQHPTPIKEAASSGVKPPRGPLVFEKPDGNPEDWSADEFWVWAQYIRQKSKYLPETQKPRGLGSWYSTARMTPMVSVRVLQEAYYAFGRDPYWEKERPPFPFGGFISQWAKYASTEVSHAS